MLLDSLPLEGSIRCKAQEQEIGGERGHNGEAGNPVRNHVSVWQVLDYGTYLVGVNRDLGYLRDSAT